MDSNKINDLINAISPILKAVDSDNVLELKNVCEKEKGKLTSALEKISPEDIIGIAQTVVNKSNNNNQEQTDNKEKQDVNESKENELKNNTIDDVIELLLNSEGKDYFEEELINTCINDIDGIDLLKKIATTNTSLLMKIAKPICDKMSKELDENELSNDALHNFVVDMSNAAANVLKDYIDISNDNTEQDNSQSEYNLGKL